MMWFGRQKLNVKFTMVIGLIVFVPLIMIYLILFSNLKNTTMNQAVDTAESDLQQTYSEIQKTVDLCNMSTQMFLNYQNLITLLTKLKRGDSIPTDEIVSFYQNDIAMLERLVNSNPYLYRIRVYAQSDDFSEMMPILYRQQRMDALPWKDTYVSGEWQYDYRDEVFGSVSTRTPEHVMSLVTNIEDYELGTIGVLEVAVDMSRIFPQLFADGETSWACFTDQNGAVRTEIEDSRYEVLREEILKAAEAEGQEGSYCHLTRIGGEQVILGSVPVRELSGYLVQLISVKDELAGLDYQRNIALTLVAVIYILLIFLINYIVKSLLRQFYRVMETIHQVEEGNLDVLAPEEGSDEISELGARINKMLDRIKSLIEENVNRERLAKNSEIRALQNQINAHFIYNVLESIKMMAEIQGEYDISDAITSLGRLLRYSMRWTSQNVTVRQEIQYIRDYLELINLRYDFTITLALKISELVYEQNIPKMSLQPIVENAICHGIEEVAEDASIYIKAVEYDEYCQLEITDSGKGMTEEQVEQLKKKIAGEIEVSGGSGNGIGLKNVQDRIRMSFGEPYGISVVSKEGCFTKVIVSIPITQTVLHKEEAQKGKKEKQHEESVNC